MFRLYSQTCLFFDQARLDQCKVTMEALEKQLEEEKQKVLNTESQRGAATGKRPGSSRKKKTIPVSVVVILETTVRLQLPRVT